MPNTTPYLVQFFVAGEWRNYSTPVADLLTVENLIAGSIAAATAVDDISGDPKRYRIVQGDQITPWGGRTIGAEAPRPYERDKAIVAAAVAEFPPAFGLRAFPGKVFRVSLKSSYMGGLDGKTIQLYTEVANGDKWQSFAKGTPAELRAEITEVK